MVFVPGKEWYLYPEKGHFWHFFTAHEGSTLHFFSEKCTFPRNVHFSEKSALFRSFRQIVRYLRVYRPDLVGNLAIPAILVNFCKLAECPLCAPVIGQISVNLSNLLKSGENGCVTGCQKSVRNDTVFAPVGTPRRCRSGFWPN